MRTESVLTVLAMLGLTVACQKQPPSPAAQPKPAFSASSDKAAAWTVDRVRQFVVDTEQMALNERGRALKQHQNAQADGQCYGEAAYPMGKASEIVPVLETRLTGKALRCYLATFFGCQRDGLIASAGVSLNEPTALAFHEAPAKILEQTPDRIVAEVGEAEFNMVLDGHLDPKQADGKAELLHKSRYTLTRDAKGVWRISDRIPSFKDWECREK
jgi:hypothetical protein